MQGGGRGGVGGGRGGMRGGGGIGGGRGGRGRGGGMRRGGNSNNADRSEIFKSIDFWEKFQLGR
jgi:hypothetical protein